MREDTARLWRSDFMRRGIDALRTRTALEEAPVTALAALAVAEKVLTQPVA